MRNLRLVTMVCAVFITGMVACKKGDTGPAGAAGAAGATGPAGPDSVLTSGWISLATTQDTGDTLWAQDLAAPLLTQDILDNGVVISYINIVDANNNNNYINVSAAGGLLFETYDVGNIFITSDQDLTGLPYRYVVIPGKVAASNAAFIGLTKQQIQTMSYSQVTKALGTSSASTN